MIIPILFISNEMVVENAYLKAFSEIFDDTLKNIHRASESGAISGFYHKIKFQYVYSLFIMIPLSLLMFYLYSKAYLCSVGFIKNCKEIFKIKTIQKNGIDRNYSMILYSCIFNFLVFEIVYLGSFDSFYDAGNVLHDTVLTSYLLCFVGTYLGFSLPYIILETIAHIYKNIKLKDANNE